MIFNRTGKQLYKYNEYTRPVVQFVQMRCLGIYAKLDRLSMWSSFQLHRSITTHSFRWKHCTVSIFMFLNCTDAAVVQSALCI